MRKNQQAQSFNNGCAKLRGRVSEREKERESFSWWRRKCFIEEIDHKHTV